MDHVEQLPLVGPLDRHAVALRERRDRLLLTRGEERAVAVEFVACEPCAVMEVHLVHRRHGAVDPRQVGLEARDVAVLHRLLDRHRADEHVVLAGLDGDRPVREPHALARARIARRSSVAAPQPSSSYDLALDGIVRVVLARLRDHRGREVRIRRRRRLRRPLVLRESHRRYDEDRDEIAPTIAYTRTAAPCLRHADTFVYAGVLPQHAPARQLILSLTDCQDCGRSISADLSHQGAFPLEPGSRRHDENRRIAGRHPGNSWPCAPLSLCGWSP